MRQSDAHTWAEVYLRPDQIPPELMHGKDYWHASTTGGWGYDKGGWLRLDPTPGGEAAVEPSAWLAPLPAREDWLDFAWSNYVVELDYRRQRDAIYQPIIGAVQSVLRELWNAERWKAVFSPLAALLHIGRLRA